MGIVPGVYHSFVPPAAATVLATGVPVFIGYGLPRAEVASRPRSPAWPVALPWLARAGAPAPSASGGPWNDSGYTQPWVLTQWSQFADGPGRWSPDPYLQVGVQGFFDCGGKQCQVVLIDRARAFAIDRPSVEVWTRILEKLIPDLADVDLVCLPSLMCRPDAAKPTPIDPETLGVTDAVYQIQARVLAECERETDLFAVLDSVPLPPVPRETFDRYMNRQIRELLRWIALTAMGQKSERAGALYGPWIELSGRPHVLFPASGHVAGIYAFTDGSGGVDKPPANQELPDVADLAAQLTDADQAALDSRFNCLRAFPGRGIVIWGASTLSQNRAWTYVSVRRLFITVARWLVLSTSWAVFEPNDLALWLRLNRELTAYLRELFYRGVLAGRSPADAFYVKCDDSNNPPSAARAGQLNVEIGMVPAVPGEMIILRLTQSSAGSTLSVEE